MGRSRIDIRVLTSVVALLALACLALTACQVTEPSVQAQTIRIGVLPTEHALPLYVAAEETTTEGKDIEVEITRFTSVQARNDALAAGEIDGVVGGVADVASLASSGPAVKVVTLMLGATPAEGRFGIVVPKGSTVERPMDLRGVPVAVASGTISEYVVDELLAAEGLTESEITKVESQNVAERAQLLTEGKLKAAALPDPLLAYVESWGATVVIDDTKRTNLSQAVLALKTDFTKEHPEAVRALLGAHADAVEAINEDPESYRDMLVETARVHARIAETYRLNAYPEPQLPDEEDVEDLLGWLRARGIVSPHMTYEELVEDPAGQK